MHTGNISETTNVLAMYYSYKFVQNPGGLGNFGKSQTLLSYLLCL